MRYIDELSSIQIALQETEHMNNDRVRVRVIVFTDYCIPGFSND